jgi:xanthine dehydrogenase accessory factor
MQKILIRGSGDIGSAIAQRLFLAGWAISIHDNPQSTATRRKMAFTDAIFDGSALLEGIEARRVDDPSLVESILPARAFIPLLVCDFNELLQVLHPGVLIDARMRKHLAPESQIHLAPLTIGLGPNFTAGENVHLAIETGRGESLGQVISHGPTRHLQGEPLELAGHARDRYVYAPAAGLFQTTCQIGELVTHGQIIAHLDGAALLAPLSGLLRGLTRDGIAVSAGTKLIEIDPRGSQAQISGIAARPARITQGVIEALQNFIP